MSELKELLPLCHTSCVYTGRQVSVETAAGPDVFPGDVLGRPRLLPSLQHLRPIGARLRRLLVRVDVHVGARLLSQVPVLPAQLANRPRRHATRRRRQVHQRAVVDRCTTGTCSRRINYPPTLTIVVFESLMNDINCYLIFAFSVLHPHAIYTLCFVKSRLLVIFSRIFNLQLN